MSEGIKEEPTGSVEGGALAAYSVEELRDQRDHLSRNISVFETELSEAQEKVRTIPDSIKLYRDGRDKILVELKKRSEGIQ